MKKQRIRGKRGPEAQRLKLKLDWKQAVAKAMKKPPVKPKVKK